MENTELEQEVRTKWSTHMEFVITCIGYAVGLGNVWRFPYLCYRNGGGAFLVPYFLCLIILGLPIFFLEIVFGQFSGVGTLTAWEINPLFKGLGITMICVSMLIGIYYNVVVAICIYFMFASLKSVLPWSTCDNHWNTCHCRPDTMETSLINSVYWYNQTNKNCVGVSVDEKTRQSPSHEFFYRKVLELTSGIQDMGGVKWDLTLCNLLMWLVVYLTIIRGVKSMGKVVYVSALFPYVLMTTLLVKSSTLKGASKGVEFYMSFDFDKINQAEVWKAAASQILFSLSCCMGSLMAMSSYNRFHENSVRDTILISLINSGTSFYVGFAVFTTLGFMSEVTGRDIESVGASGPGLVFVAYPIALAQLPLSQMWSFFFFLMMVLLGLGSQFPTIETVVTAFQDEFHWLRKPRNNYILRAIVCLTGFVLGIPQTTRGGLYLLYLCDTFVVLPLLLVGFFQVLAVVTIYGIPRFSEDMMLMIGYSKGNVFIFNYYLKWTLAFITPGVLLWIILYSAVKYTPISADGSYPVWAEVLGWLIVAFIVMWTPLWYIISYCCKGGYKLLKELNQPTSKWGPADPSRRTIRRYQLASSADVENNRAVSLVRGAQEQPGSDSEIPDSLLLPGNTSV